jgi:hypothetical protein
VQSSRLTYLLPRRIGLYCREPKVVRELVLFEVGKDDGCEGGEEGGTLVYGAVMDRFPYLSGLVGSRLGLVGL